MFRNGRKQLQSVYHKKQILRIIQNQYHCKRSNKQHCWHQFVETSTSFFCFRGTLQNINNYQYIVRMGACLAASASRTQQSQLVPSTTENRNLRTQIEKQLRQTSHEANTPAEEFSFHPMTSLNHNTSLRVDNTSEASAQASQGSRHTVTREKRSGRSIKHNSLKKVNQVSLGDATELNVNNPAEVEQSKSQESRDSSSSASEDQIEQNLVQNPNNRKQRPLQENMLDKGLTEDDNRLIACTMGTSIPMRLTEIRLKNLSIYSGEWLQGKRHGQGKLRWQDGSTYSGNWENNCSHGQGRLTYANGGTYEGSFQYNKAQGKGVFTYANGSVYQGDWVNDEPEGHGILKWQDGQRYEGQWLAGKKHGTGSMFFKDGSFYKGQFSANQIHGRGYYNWVNSKEYSGCWEHNQMSGTGTLTWHNGNVYEGSFLNGKFQGQGTMHYLDGSSAEGCWEKGRKQGFFIQKDPSGKTSTIEWHMGKRAKPLIEFSRRQARRIKQEQSKTTSSQDA